VILALLLAVAPAAGGPELIGGRVYRALIPAGGARVALWRYSASGERSGPPVLLLPELGFDRTLFDPGLAPALQARGRDVYVLEWRGTGRSTAALPGMGGLDALFSGDAPAALGAIGEKAQIVGVGLGGAAAYLLAARGGVSAVVAISVPAAWEVPNEAVRGVMRAAGRAAGSARAPLDLRRWSRTPAPVGDGRRDLLQLLFEHGDALGPRLERLRDGLGSAAPELVADVGRWMERGEPRLVGPRLRDALAALAVPLLVVAAPRDNWVHPEHALAVRRLAPRAPRDEMVLSRIEGFGSDAGHLAVAAPWAARGLFPKIADWLDGHK